MSYQVYWLSNSAPKTRAFGDDELVPMLKFTEELRKMKIAGDDIAHITSSSENPNSVTKLGVDVTGADYDWKKRRV